MGRELRDKLIYLAVGTALGLVTGYAAVWRDTAVMKAELVHIREDISLIQTFIASDDPARWAAAKLAIKAEHAKDAKQ